MIFVALLFVVPFVVGQQDSGFVPSNGQPPQGSAPASSPQVGGQISIQPGSGALPPFDPNNPHANQQSPNSQGQIPPTFNTQGGQLNQQQPAQQPFDSNNPQPNQQKPFDHNNPQPNQQHPFDHNNPQPNQQQPFDPNNPQPNQQQPNTHEGINIQPNSQQPTGGEIVQPGGQPNPGTQGGSSTQELFGNQATSQGSSTSAAPNQEQLEHGQDHQNQATVGFTGQPANSAVNAIVSGLVLLFAAIIALL